MCVVRTAREAHAPSATCMRRHPPMRPAQQGCDRDHMSAHRSVARRLHGEPRRDEPRHMIADAPRRPTMPTMLPARQAPPPALDDLAGFLLVLAQVYVVIAGVLWIGVAIEYHL